MTKKTELIFFIMGVSGTGKSTIGKLLSKELEIPFFDGDDYHPQSNIDKMAAGHPLNDTDRHDWLLKLNSIALAHNKQGAVIACSSLKKIYRNLLTKDVAHYYFVFLEGSFDLIMARMRKRNDHFMPPELLKSQFNDLEIPEQSESVITVSLAHTPNQIITEIKNQL